MTQPMPAPAAVRAHQERAYVPLVVADGPQTAPEGPQPAPHDFRVDAIAEVLRGLPLASYAAQMVETADADRVDWHLLPVIGFLESTGGLYACGGNAWGWTSCRVPIGTFDQGIAVVAAALAAPPYAGQPAEIQLCTWVGAAGCPDYLAKAMWEWARLDAALERLR